MRFVAEYLENTAQLLLRFLSEPTVSGDIVQLGAYAIDGTPLIPCVIHIDIDSDVVKSGEARTYLTGYWPLPTYLDITLPDASTQRVVVSQVLQHTSSWEPLLIEQSVDAIKPIEPDMRRPGEGQNPYKPEPTRPPDYPDLWIEMSLERTDPVRLGDGMISDPLVYVGGCEGRALSSSIKQTAQDAPPYLSYAPVRLEGQFTNSLVNSNFAISPSWPTPHFDPLPNGWSVTLADPMSMVRMQVSEPEATLPTFTLRYRQRADSDVSSVPPVIIQSPAITNAGETFQVIVAPSSGNAQGRIQLKTEDDAVASPLYNLNAGSAFVALLPIGTHTGRVKIIWDQTKGEGEEQILQLIAPNSSVYTGSHSYIPTGMTSYADVLTLSNVEFDKPWFFNRGSIRIDGSGDNLTQPYSWKLLIGTQNLLKVDAGVLSSDFMAQPAITLSNYLTSTLSYKIVWTSLTSFKLTDASGITSVSIPFSLDLTSIDGTTAALTVELIGYKPNEGSAVAKRWAYLPT
jgi:hypothetical protein